MTRHHISVIEPSDTDVAASPETVQNYLHALQECVYGDVDTRDPGAMKDAAQDMRGLLKRISQALEDLPYKIAAPLIKEIEANSGDLIADMLGVEVRWHCESCSSPIYSDEPYSFDHINGLEFCEHCTPSWNDMLAEPDRFVQADDEEHTPETAKAAADAHVAAGGSLYDKIGLIEPEGQS